MQRFWESIARHGGRLVYVMLFGFRCSGRQNYPRQGGALICANHQSHLDPFMVGLTNDRRLNYLARKSLFDHPWFGGLIRYWDAIPIERDGMGIGGIKESLRRLRRGEMLLIFPEGTRTRDGEVADFKPGFCALARRGRVPIVPVGFDGAFDAWPRSSRCPRPAAINFCVGEPISCELIESLDDDELVEEVARRIRRCHDQARTEKLRRRWSGLHLKPRTQVRGS